MDPNLTYIIPLSDHNYQGYEGKSPNKQKIRKNYTENEKQIIRDVHSYFVKLLEENNIVNKKDGYFKQKTAGIMTREAIGITKSTFYRIIHDHNDKEQNKSVDDSLTLGICLFVIKLLILLIVLIVFF